MEIEPADVNVFSDYPQSDPPLSDDAKEEQIMFPNEFQDEQALVVQISLLPILQAVTNADLHVQCRLSEGLKMERRNDTSIEILRSLPKSFSSVKNFPNMNSHLDMSTMIENLLTSHLVKFQSLVS